MDNYNVEVLKKVKCFLLDMDGTINLGDKLIDGAKEFFDILENQGKNYIFVTNNSSRNIDHYQKKLARLGLEVTKDQILTSTEVLIHYLNDLKPKAKIFPVGTEHFEHELTKAGFNLIYELGQQIDFVAVGFDMSLDYEKLSNACRYIDKGVPYVATHPDIRCPIAGGEFIPDCGAIIAFIKAATGKNSEKIVGKPEPAMVDFLVKKMNLSKTEMAMIGDRLYTDIAMGINSSIISILVLTGETSRDDVAKSEFKPDFVMDSIKDIKTIIE
jgi:NagD protein